MINFRKIDNKNLWEVVKLSVQNHQKGFVATNTESLLEAYVSVTTDKVALPLAIYKDDTLVGFVMFAYGVFNESNPKIATDNYCIWRFMIDEKYQGQGLGKKAFKYAIDYLRTNPCEKEKAEYCWLSYEPENEGAKRLYESFGFKETKEICDDEIVLLLKL